MAKPSPEYELVLMLDPEAPDDRREQIAADARKRIESGGSLKHDTSWGMRKLAYEIRQRTEADYRFFRFETGGALLDELNHNLKIADGVLRFRIFKVDPRNPVIVPPPPTPLSAGRPERGGRRGRDGGRDGGRGLGEADSEPVAAPVEPVQAPTAEQPPAPAEQPEAPAEQPQAPAEQPEAAPAEAPAEPEAPPAEAPPSEEAPASDDEQP